MVSEGGVGVWEADFQNEGRGTLRVRRGEQFGRWALWLIGYWGNSFVGLGFFLWQRSHGDGFMAVN